jgi:hypothetical protein
MMNDQVEVLYVYRCTACAMALSFICRTTHTTARPPSARPVALLSVSSGTVASRLRLDWVTRGMATIKDYAVRRMIPNRCHTPSRLG